MQSADSHQERPEVVDYEQELALAYDSAISAHHIEEASGGQGLDEIVRLTLQIDTSDKSISTLGFLVPNLRELILDHSRIASVRDLGVGLRQLLTISLNDCAINELDGIASLVNLEILSLRNNGIMDVSPIAMHDKLQVIYRDCLSLPCANNDGITQKLDLHGNRIYDISAGDILSSCPKLSSLVLTKNPIDRAQHYRAVICALIPQLCELDCIPVDPDLRCKVTNAMILDTSAAMNQIREDIEDEERLEMCIMDTDNASQLHLNSQNSIDRVKNSEANRGHGRGSSALGAEPDTGSELTHGSDVVLAGGVAAAMRRRRANRAFDGGESARASYESNASDDHVNVIGLLDAMSRGSGTPSSVLESGSSSYLQEGDLTISVLGHQPRPGTSAGRPTTSSSPRPSTSLKRQKNSQSPPVPSSPSNLERKKSSNRRLLSDADESVNNISFPDPFARPNSGGRPPRSPLLGGSSPRMASPHQHNETRPGTTLSNGRPMTSYSSCSDDGANLSELAISAPSAPFKITIPLAMKGEDLNALRSRLAPPSASCSEDEGADDHDTVFSGRSTSSRSSKYKEPPLRISTARQTASATALKDLDEYDNCGGAVNKKISEHKYGAEESIQTGSNQVKGIALLGKSSIVHRDVVKRRTNRFCSDEDDDDEDIHVDHNSRHNLMTHKDRGLVGGGTSSPKVASRGAKLGADLMAQMNGSRKVDAFAIDEEIALKRKTAGSVHKNIAEDIFTSRPPVAPIGGPTLSSIVSELIPSRLWQYFLNACLHRRGGHSVSTCPAA